MVKLPAGFVLSQSSLQDLADCARRFQLRYLSGTLWPASHSVGREWDLQVRRGSVFHELLYQHALGIPPETLHRVAAQHGLATWWQAYLSTPPSAITGSARRAEVHLSIPLAEFRLTARYDLLALSPSGRATIVDWKTGVRRPSRMWLERRWQTMVYPFVLAEAGDQYNHDRQLGPEQIELVYWFANFPAQTEHFAYDAARHITVGQALRDAVERIHAHQEANWPLTSDEKQCRWCAYQTLCGRQAVDSPDLEMEPESEAFEFDLDIEQIAEIGF